MFSISLLTNDNKEKMKYAINDEILFAMDLETARFEYNHQRKVEERKFRKAMRRAARKRKRGGTGPLKPLSMEEVMSNPPRGTKHTCSECPVWKPSYCGITCATKIAAHPACKYGLQRINNERTKAWHRRNGN